MNFTAFKKLGLDCANWPEPVYADLLRYVISKFCNNIWFDLCALAGWLLVS